MTKIKLKYSINDGICKIPEGVEEIHDHEFSSCKKLIRLILPNSIKRIGKGAFYGCSNLIDISLNDNSKLQNIERDAFRRCTSLQCIKLPSSLKTIGKDSFKDCKELHTVVMGDSVKKIGFGAFYGCYKLKNINASEHVNRVRDTILRIIFAYK